MNAAAKRRLIELIQADDLDGATRSVLQLWCDQCVVCEAHQVPADVDQMLDWIRQTSRLMERYFPASGHGVFLAFWKDADLLPARLVIPRPSAS